MSIGIVGKPSHMRVNLNKKNPLNATGKLANYLGSAARKANLSLKQQTISLRQAKERRK